MRLFLYALLIAVLFVVAFFFCLTGRSFATSNDIPCAKEAEEAFKLNSYTYQGDECFPSSRAFCNCQVHELWHNSRHADASQQYEDCLMRSAMECHEAEISKQLGK